MGELIGGLFIILLANIVLRVVIGVVRSLFSGKPSPRLPKKLTIRTDIKKVESGLLAGMVNLFGVIQNPIGVNPTCILNALDVTEAREPKPIFCNAPNWSDDDGVFLSAMDFEAPFEYTDVQGSTIGVMPLSILEFPRSGRRKIKVYAVIFIGQLSLATIESTFIHNNENKGYLDILDAIQESEVTIAKLSVAVSAIDGSIDAIELNAINDYFKQRFDQVGDSAERKSRVLTALRDYSKTFNSGNKSTTTIQNEISQMCREIAAHDNTSISESALQLALEVISEDQRIEVEEKDVIEQIKSLLNIDIDTAASLEDRIIRIQHYVDADDESKLGMPSNLSDVEKKAWLAKEYVKWKNRVTHPNPTKSKEATERLDLITRCRDKIPA